MAKELLPKSLKPILPANLPQQTRIQKTRLSHQIKSQILGRTKGKRSGAKSKISNPASKSNRLLRMLTDASENIRLC